jgi:hypothetical protein
MTMRRVSTNSVIALGVVVLAQGASVMVLGGVTMFPVPEQPKVVAVSPATPLLPEPPLVFPPHDDSFEEGNSSKLALQAEKESALDKSAKPVILHRHSERVRNAIKAIVPIARGARVVAVEYPPVQKTAPVTIQVSPGSAVADESETPRPTTTFCRKIGNPKSPSARKEICFERDDVLRKVVRTYEKD